ncbi:MAG: hypothetical protein R2818_05930 [Flavobacteriales bacterium]
MNCRNSSNNALSRTTRWCKAVLLGAAFALVGTANAQVDLTATGGVLNQSYTTLKGAFDAINAGTHTGVISIGISANTTETATASLNNSGAGSANYTSVSIAPTGGARVISGSIASAIVKLNGVDNVTIDGRTPGPVGTSRSKTPARPVLRPSGSQVRPGTVVRTTRSEPELACGLRRTPPPPAPSALPCAGQALDHGERY